MLAPDRSGGPPTADHGRLTESVHTGHVYQSVSVLAGDRGGCPIGNAIQCTGIQVDR